VNLPFVSVDKNSRYFRADIDPFKVEIYFNGNKIMDCFEAHAQKGYVIRVKRDRGGNYSFKDGKLERELKYGNVCIFYPDEE
jgi:hypothetical protein